MNLLPVPARVPARKHLLAGAVALFSVGLMLAAVLGTAGLPTPFNAGSSARVSTSPIERPGRARARQPRPRMWSSLRGRSRRPRRHAAHDELERDRRLADDQPAGAHHHDDDAGTDAADVHPRPG